MLGEAELLYHLVSPPPNVGLGGSRQRRVPDERRVGAPFRGNGDQLGQISDAIALDVGARGESVDLDRSRGRPEISEHHGEESTLPRPVRARDTEDLAFNHLQRKLLDRFYRVAEE